jgi:2,4-dienoyl-CoA reductase-like NADH-dependent reductase (Old Yellow Enzyme family)
MERREVSILFEQGRIKNLRIRNLFVRSATYDGYADKYGHVTQKQESLFTDLSAGGVGLIMTGATYVHDTGQRREFQNSIANDHVIPGLRKLTSAVHKWGAKIAVQLFHGGREARFVKTKNILPMAPSFLENDPYFKSKHRAIRESEIWEIINAFGDAARRAKEAEFDGVQIHGAHGMLFSQFLSPYTNRTAFAFIVKFITT